MRHNFKKLDIWKRSRVLVKEIYLVTKSFPREELFGLVSQMRRSSVSIPSNIAEGCGRGTDKQLGQFLDIAVGSNCELETQVYLANDLNLINAETRDRLANELSEIRRMIIKFKERNC